MNTQQITLDSKQQEAFDAMVAGKSILLTAKAGAGKSLIVSMFYEKYKYERVIGLTSTTGTSAILLNGTTLHSYTGIGLGTGSVDALVMKITRSPYLGKRWRELETLIVDEASMFSPALFEKLELIARIVRRNELPFGGIQLILSADFLQLPCVDSDQFCFESDVYKKCIKKEFYLTRIYRQDDIDFQDCLNDVRIGKLSKKSLSLLNSRVDIELKNDAGIKPTKLYSLNATVDTINNDELEKLDGDVYQYDMEVCFYKNGTNKNALLERFKKYCRAPEELKLCVGAQVMLLHNMDIQNQLVNGSRGVVINFIEDFPVVRFVNGLEKIIDYYTWEVEENDKKLMSFSQVPLRLAWAYTCHKAQGQTLDYVEVDLSNVFEYGQAYVALSRAKTLNGLSITGFSPKKIKAHPVAVDFYKKLEEE